MTLNESQMRAYREARREGMAIRTALYVARPPLLTLDWQSHYQVDGEWADFGDNGFRYRVTATDPRVTGGQCDSCMELVRAWRAKDDGIAWMTDEEYEDTEHRILSVVMLDSDDEDTSLASSLYGVCGMRRTPTEIRLDDRYVAETVLDLASETNRDYERREARRREARLAEETRFGELIEELTAYAETLAGGHITRSEFFDRATRLVHGYLGTEKLNG